MPEPATQRTSPLIDIRSTPEEIAKTLEDDVRTGLGSRPYAIPPRWFYDQRGSELFAEITRLPEYYPTRTESSILRERATEIARLARPRTLVELGSGTSEKTRLLLDSPELETYAPFDVSQETLAASAAKIAADFDGLRVEAVLGDFRRHLNPLPGPGPRLVAFLGGTIGNFVPVERSEFLATVSAALSPGEHLLLGTDLKKDPRRLVAAYDDASGVTAAFNRNVLTVINRELEADFDPTDFDHVAIYDARNGWIEMRLRSRRDQTPSIRSLGLEVPLEAGEDILTEISAKFDPEQVEAELSAAGFELVAFWTDQAGDFALSLSAKA